MNKNEMEQVFRKMGTEPVLREKLGAYDLFIADGLSRPPHLRFQNKDFNINPDDFPYGMYVTQWWLGKQEEMVIGRPLFIDAIDIPSQESRINAARKDAQHFYNKIRPH